MMRRALVLLLFAAFVAIISPAVPASAATGIPVQSDCLNEAWYVNNDEEHLLPEQKPDGLLFDGPSLVHHLATGLLKDASGDGSFAVKGDVVGVNPLFKMETLNPYSTINKTDAGKFWSSKIASGPGSQSEPVDTLATLAVLPPYTEATTMLSFGVGYANDVGNKALVTSVTFAGQTYDLTCQPEEEPTPDPTSTPTPDPEPSATETTAPPVAAGPTLPVTGSSFPWGLVIAGAMGLAIGTALLIAGRKKRHRIENS